MPSETLKHALQKKINAKTKPLGALGVLEQIAFKIGCIQNTTTPVLKKPSIVVFAGDHGIALRNEVNPYPQDVTAQMVYNFVNGGAAINVFSRTNSIDLHIVDAGVNHNFDANLNITDAKIAFGTKNYQDEPAMTMAQCEAALKKGSSIVKNIHQDGCNTIGFGEMGIANTSAAALLMAYFTKTPITNCVGSGTGLSQEGIHKKTNILTKVYNMHNPKTPLEALATFGGFEIAMLCGAIRQAAALDMVIIIDGFIVTAALLAAHAISPEVINNCIFAHSSEEQGHKNMLRFLNAKPLLHLGLRLGEGTGAALALPLLEAAVNFLNEMASFESAGVSEETKLKHNA